MAKTLEQKDAGSFVLRVNGVGVILLLSAVLSGLVTEREAATFGYHAELGLASSVFGLFGLTLLLFYIIMTGAYIKEGVRLHNLEEALIGRLSRIKARLFPPTVLTMLLLIGSPVAGAALLSGNINQYFHLFTAIGVAITYIVTFRVAKKELMENRAIAMEVFEKTENA